MTKRIFVLAFTVESVEGEALHRPDLSRLIYHGLEGVYGKRAQASNVTFIDESPVDHPVETWVRERCERNIARQAAIKAGETPPDAIEQVPDQDA
jgi:hypothetical protein